MRAILSAEPGPPETLELREIERPTPKKGEVLVRVNVAALNFFDTLIIEDKYQFKPPRPFPIAAEMAGVVEEAGPGTEGGFEAGERVCGYHSAGCSAEYVAVPAAALSRTPDGVSDEQAACIMVTYGTSYHALKDRAKLADGETCAVLGASGGVGQAAVELAKVMGAHVIACASSDEKLAFARECGADEGINYAEADLKDALKKAAPGGVDVIYDPVGGDLAEAAFRSIAWGGRFLVIGFAAGPIPRIPLNLPLLKGADLRGVFWGRFTQTEPEANRANVDQLLAWLADGTLRPHVDSVFPLEDAAKALKKIAARDVKGKVLLRVAG